MNLHASPATHPREVVKYRHTPRLRFVGGRCSVLEVDAMGVDIAGEEMIKVGDRVGWADFGRDVSRIRVLPRLEMWFLR